MRDKKLALLKEKNRHEEEMAQLRGKYPIDENEVRQLVKKYITENSVMNPITTTASRFVSVDNINPEPKQQKIRIRYKEGAQPLKKISQGDWIDLYTYEQVTGKVGDFKLIDLGVAMQLPKGYEAIMAARSSTFKKYGIIQTNAIGVFDNSYCGDNDWWLFAAYFTQNVIIPTGTRIAQFRIQKCQPNLEFIAVESLGNKDRGGIGSTGD